jgi:hypothetical protein
MVVLPRRLVYAEMDRVSIYARLAVRAKSRRSNKARDMSGRDDKR